MTASSQVIELRQYTLKPGRRDDLIALFEREFIETQEAEGIRLIGQFVDLDDPDRFVWLRGFPDMASRKASLTAFYGGPAWAANRDAANDTMIDSDNVLMLRPLAHADDFTGTSHKTDPSETVLIVGVHDRPDDVEGLDGLVRTTLIQAGLSPIAVLETETAENDFPRLPVRTDGRYVIWFSRASSRSAADHVRTGLEFGGRLGPVRESLTLCPTPLSRLRP